MQTPRDNLIDSLDAVRDTIGRIRSSKVYSRLSDAQRAFIDDQLFGTSKINRFTPMSALQARISSLAALIGTASIEFQSLLGGAPSPILGTFSFSNGEIELGHPLKNVQTTFVRVVEELQKERLAGILIPDIDVIQRSELSRPKLAFHVHGLLVSEKPKVRLKATANRIGENIGWPTNLPRAVDLSGKRPGPTVGHAMRIAGYSGKFTSAMKRLAGKEQDKFYRSRSHYTDELLFYVLHAWSQLPLLSSVVGVGEAGNRIQARWRRQTMRAKARIDAREIRYSGGEMRSRWAEILPLLRG